MSTKARDPYSVLGVRKDASEQDIRSAWVKLAKKWHPDRHQESEKARQEAERRIKEINEAYETLSDPERRARFDRFGADGPFGSAGQGPFRPGQGPFGGGGFGGAGFGGEGFGRILEGMFEDLFRAEAPRGRTGGAAPRQPEEVRIDVRLREAHEGTRKKLRLRTQEPCGVCQGRRPTGPAPCPSCQGIGIKVQERTVEVNLPAGVRDGARLRVPAPDGDMVLRVALLPHPLYTISGDDLEVDLPVAPHEAVLGAEVSVPTLEGQVRLKVPEGSQGGRILRMKGKGLSRRGGGRGDMLVRLVIRVPEAPDPETRRLYEALGRQAVDGSGRTAWLERAKEQLDG